MPRTGGRTYKNFGPTVSLQDSKTLSSSSADEHGPARGIWKLWGLSFVNLEIQHPTPRCAKREYPINHLLGL